MSFPIVDMQTPKYLSDPEYLRLDNGLRTDIYCRCIREVNGPHDPHCEWNIAVHRLYEMARRVKP